MGAVNGQRELGVDGREICRVDDGPYRSAMGTTGSGAVGHRLPHGCSAVSPRSLGRPSRGASPVERHIVSRHRERGQPVLSTKWCVGSSGYQPSRASSTGTSCGQIDVGEGGA